MKVSSSSVLPLSSSSEIATPASSSSEVIVPETSSSEMITESSSSQMVLPPTSSSDEIVIPESSSSDVVIAETSSSMESLLPSSSSVVAAAIAKIHLQISERDLLVFDMQGKFLGKIEVKNGESLNEVLKTRFRKSGAYLVKQDHLMQRVNVK
ncbi:MAG: hypothetical protein MJZ25_10935 [Fibrobacter sp.]|nr:hypothetical protein [Fibrobacter sp.]